MDNSALLLRLQGILEKSKSNIKRYSSEGFIEKLGEIAELTRVRQNDALSIHSDDVLATVKSAEAAAEYLEIAVEAGLLTRSSQGEPLFRDIFDRDGHAARYLMRYLKSDYVDQGLIRDQAVSALVQIGAPAIPQLIQCLGHDESDVRWAASVALQKLGDIAVPALIQALNYGNEHVRRSVADALISESSKLATEPLIKLLLNDEAPLVRASAALALKEGGTQEGIEALVDALKDDHSLVLLMVKGALEDLDTPLARRALYDYKSGPKRSSDNQQRIKELEEDLKQAAKPPRIFLSYPREHSIDVRRLRKLFLDAGFEVWLDSEKLLAGQRWEKSLNDAIESSDFVVAFLSKHTSDGFQMEELRAAAQYIPKGKSSDYVFLFPCVVDSEIWNGLPETVPEFLQKYHMIDMKNLEDGWLELREAITTAARIEGFFVPVYLRTERRIDLVSAEVNRMLVTRNYYDKKINNQGRPPYMDFGDLKTLEDGALIQDLATHRTWSRDCLVSRSDQERPTDRIRVVNASVAQMNKEKLGGFSDWRIPTIEEAMSLMMPHAREGGYYISKLFSDHPYVLTCDSFYSSQVMKSMYWIACYGHGDCQSAPGDLPASVRLVRSGV